MICSNEDLHEFLETVRTMVSPEERAFYVESESFQDSSMKALVRAYVANCKIRTLPSTIFRPDVTMTHCSQIDVSAILTLLEKEKEFPSEADKMLTNVYCCSELSLDGKTFGAKPLSSVTSLGSVLQLGSSFGTYAMSAYDLEIFLKAQAEENGAALFSTFQILDKISSYYHSEDEHALLLFTKDARRSIATSDE